MRGIKDSTFPVGSGKVEITTRRYLEWTFRYLRVQVQRVALFNLGCTAAFFISIKNAELKILQHFHQHRVQGRSLVEPFNLDKGLSVVFIEKTYRIVVTIRWRVPQKRDTR